MPIIAAQNGVLGNRVWRPIAGGFEVGVWDRGNANRGWFYVEWPGLPWRHHDFPQLAFSHRDGRSVLISAGVKEDDSRWAHISVARQNRIPSYKDLAEVKDLFVGPDRYALQVFAPASEHVNLHPYCLHLWVPMDRYPLPNFVSEDGMI